MRDEVVGFERLGGLLVLGLMIGPQELKTSIWPGWSFQKEPWFFLKLDSYYG